MAEELELLIEKIKEEGIKAAEEEARKILEEARAKAKSVVEVAERDAAVLITGAREKNKKLEESTLVSLRQAGRDLLIELRKEINELLDNVIASHVHKALGHEEMAKLIVSLVKDLAVKGQGVVVSVKKEDLEKLEKGIFSELRAEAKKGVILKAADDIRGGFRISYDEGKSYYDFTDQAIAEYIGSSLKPRLAWIFKETASGPKG